MKFVQGRTCRGFIISDSVSGSVKMAMESEAIDRQRFRMGKSQLD